MDWVSGFFFLFLLDLNESFFLWIYLHLYVFHFSGKLLFLFLSLENQLFSNILTTPYTLSLHHTGKLLFPWITEMVFSKYSMHWFVVTLWHSGPVFCYEVQESCIFSQLNYWTITILGNYIDMELWGLIKISCVFRELHVSGLYSTVV